MSVARGTGEARILRSGPLFNNPLGLALVVNRAPAAELTFAPRRVAGGRMVSFDASGSTDPERLPLRYEWDLDGNGSFETGSGTQARTSLTFASSTTLVPGVRCAIRTGRPPWPARGRRSRSTPSGRCSRGCAHPRAASARSRAAGAAGASSDLDQRIARAIRLRFRVSERVRVSVALRRALPGAACGPLREPAGGAPGRPALHALAQRGEPQPQSRTRAGEPALLVPCAQPASAEGPLSRGGRRNRPGRQSLEAEVGAAERGGAGPLRAASRAARA